MAGDSSRVELIRRVLEALDQINRSTSYKVSEEWLQVPLTMPQVRVLLVLLEEQRMRMSALASTLGITFSGATGLVDRLVERGLVERGTDPEDRRTVVCCLTEEGEQMAQRPLYIRHLLWEERLRPLTEEELQKVAEAMEIILRGTQRMAPGEPVSQEARTKGDTAKG